MFYKTWKWNCFSIHNCIHFQWDIYSKFKIHCTLAFVKGHVTESILIYYIKWKIAKNAFVDSLNAFYENLGLSKRDFKQRSVLINHDNSLDNNIISWLFGDFSKISTLRFQIVFNKFFQRWTMNVLLKNFIKESKISLNTYFDSSELLSWSSLSSPFSPFEEAILMDLEGFLEVDGDLWSDFFSFIRLSNASILKHFIT